jgi:hypothetical protein
VKHHAAPDFWACYRSLAANVQKEIAQPDLAPLIHVRQDETGLGSRRCTPHKPLTRCNGALHGVLQFHQMRNTITVRLPEDLAAWLESTAKKSGIPQGRIIREQLDKARRETARPFLRLAGTVSGPPDLSMRKGFSR